MDRPLGIKERSPLASLLSDKSCIISLLPNEKASQIIEIITTNYETQNFVSVSVRSRPDHGITSSYHSVQTFKALT